MNIEYTGNWFRKNNDNFESWFDPKTFDWEESWLLAKYCSDYFNIWWDGEKFNWEYSWELSCYCSEYFELWWNKDKFNWHDGSFYLIKHCWSYRSIWGQDKRGRDSLFGWLRDNHGFLPIVKV